MSYKTGTILVIDDEPANLMLLSQALGKIYKVHTAESGADGIRLANEIAPDLILLDIMMPDMDGLETCQHLKASSATRKIPVIFVTATNEISDEITGLALGAADFIHKPINIGITRQRIRNTLDNFRLQRQIEEHNNNLESLIAERTAQLEAKNKELIAAQYAAEASNRAKSTFIANISHELLTPLAAITGMNRLLVKSATKEQLVRCDKIDAAAQQIEGIVKHIIQLSRLEGKVMTDEVATRFNLQDVIDHAIAHFYDQASRKGIQISREIDGNVPREVHGMSSALQQALENLLSNAVKFSDRGNIQILVSTETASDSSVELLFKVVDQGKGIAESDHAKLFTNFSRVDDSLHRTEYGLGIGLAISRHLVKLMGGEIGFSSTPGLGSTFWLKVKLYNYSFTLNANGYFQRATGNSPSLPSSDSETHSRQDISEALRDLQKKLESDSIESIQAWFNLRDAYLEYFPDTFKAIDQAIDGYALPEAANILRTEINRGKDRAPGRSPGRSEPR